MKRRTELLLRVGVKELLVVYIHVNDDFVSPAHFHAVQQLGQDRPLARE